MTIPSSDCLMSNEENGLLLTPQEEKRIIKELTDAADSNSKEGDLFYVLTNRWWKVWQEYTEHDKISSPIDEHSVNFHRPNGILSKAACKPGRIDNSDLVLDKMDEGNEMELRQKLQEGDDYVLVPQDVWMKLLEWYDGGPALPRKLIPLIPKGFVVEVYLLRLQLISANDDTQLVIRISRMETVQELYNKCCEIFSLELGKVHIWDYFRKTKHKLLSDLSQTLEEAQLLMDQEILLEVQVDGVWPHGESNDTYDIDSVGNGLALIPIEPTRSPISIAGGPSLYNGSSTGYGPDLLQANSSNSAFRDTEDGYEVLNPNTKGVSGGLTGLQNLGNTCFMNSAVQCLVHTPQLVEFFLQDYSKEINRHNPLGMDGELAVAFGELLRKLWSPGRAPIAPRAFKAKLARFAPQFSGYNQHDSQELLAFLLDGLHEDLNRVKNKPYIETKDSNGRPDEEVADECWENHKARNDSIIVDVCQGQYKSTLVCPTCSKISVTFDPFMYLSLPLPSTATRSMTITVFYGDGSSLPIPFTITVPKQGCFRDLYLALSTACCLKPHESLLLAEVYESAIYRYLENHYELLSVIRDDDRIVAYRLPKIHNFQRLEILHERKQVSDYQSIGHLKLLGTPLMTFLPESAKTGADIQAAVSTVLAPLLQRKSPAHVNIAEARNENGTTMGIDGDTPMENCDPNPSASEDEPLFDIEPEQPRSAEPSFQLCLTDDKGYRRIPIESDTSIPSSSCTKILMGWSERERDLYDFSFLEDLPEVFKPGFTVKKTRQEAVTLFSCLETFLKEEPLGPDDMWYCPSCKEHKQATKKLDLWRLPDILVVHLKRFSYSRYLKNKLDTFVNFPIRDLDLTKYVRYKATCQSHLYELYAVSNHYGGLGGGHYTACVKLLEEDRWYNFDDGHVSPLGEDDVRTSAAYVLFYRRVENDEEPQSDSAP